MRSFSAPGASSPTGSAATRRWPRCSTGWRPRPCWIGAARSAPCTAR
uniref:Uncharacterized protein n=1 Tax=Arundo donax TaxID=35708 RepID=A0A0A9CIW1_ARUDO